MNKDRNSELSNKTPDNKTKNKSLTQRKPLLIAVSVLLALLLLIVGTGVGVFYHYYSLMDISHNQNINYNENVSFTDEERAEVPEGEVTLSGEPVYSDPDVMNILLIGTDERTENFNVNARADSVMVLSVNKKTNAVKLVSLERGMLVQIPDRENDILTHTFRYGGANLLMSTVRTHFSLDVDKYVRINLCMFKKLVDELGGVDVELDFYEVNALNALPGNYGLQVGVNHLNGSEALSYSRLRSIDSDWKRIERQRKVIASIKESMRDKSLTELSSLSEKCLPYVQTNLTSLEFANLLLGLPGYASGDFDQMTIPQKGTYTGLGNVDFGENSRILRRFFYGVE